MGDFERILVLDNEMEAKIMEDILKEKKIPFLIKTYHDEAYDGLFTFHKGWGHIEADPEYKEEIISIYNDIKGE